MKTLPDLTNEKAWEVVYEGANEILRLRNLLAEIVAVMDNETCIPEEMLLMERTRNVIGGAA